MMDITFKGKIRKVGNSYCVTIPSDYIKNGLLGIKDYEFRVKKGDKDRSTCIEA
jgi:antitoxin component of MazEF toxin-antitoxin module